MTTRSCWVKPLQIGVFRVLGPTAFQTDAAMSPTQGVQHPCWPPAQNRGSTPSLACRPADLHGNTPLFQNWPRNVSPATACPQGLARARQWEVAWERPPGQGKQSTPWTQQESPAVGLGSFVEVLAFELALVMAWLHHKKGEGQEVQAGVPWVRKLKAVSMLTWHVGASRALGGHIGWDERFG